MAQSDIQALASNDWLKLVAVADVDASREPESRAAFPGVRIYRDWMILLEREAGEIDSVNVSVPDHMHRPERPQPIPSSDGPVGPTASAAPRNAPRGKAVAPLVGEAPTSSRPAH